ncbi:universal stress protein [Saccharomonospora piscinae]|uniref:Universal stress protein n=1 Tax=Saccharomonospora piscinae TaxID=687388 RepID=A0A1V9A9P0_SACPI|nr:universal stress protein [Saccharomonospora piscinae]OQO93842.1 universal stress protein [Saccharomonospora piscinae]TLW95006.1 universal stress protein [Saccharomonospora piscinae]
MSRTDLPSRRIVVGIDGSATAELALRWAVTDAADRGGAVEAVAVREPDALLPGTSYTFQPRGRRPVTDDSGTRAYLRAAIAAVAAAVPHAGDVPVTETVRAGDPAGELITASERADLLVVGSHRRGALSEMLLGSVSASCVRRARCPVVVVPAGLAHTREHAGETGTGAEDR